MRLRDDVTRDMLADMMTEIMEDVKFYKDDAAKMLTSAAPRIAPARYKRLA